MHRKLTSTESLRIDNIKAQRFYRDGVAFTVAVADLGGGRSALALPLLASGASIGHLLIYRQEVRPSARRCIGRIGFEGRYDCAAIGTVTKLGARLCGEAQSGQIVVSQRVAAEIEAIADLQPLGVLALKDFHTAIRAHNVVSIRQSP